MEFYDKNLFLHLSQKTEIFGNIQFELLIPNICSDSKKIENKLIIINDLI